MLVLADAGLAPALISIAVGVVMLALTAVFVFWTRAARAAAHTGPETVIFCRGGGKLIGGAVVVALCAFAAPLVGFDGENVAIWLLLLLAFFAVIWWAQFLAPFIVFYVADHTGLTRQWLAAKKTLPWHAIDWVYPERKTTAYRTYGVKVGQSTEYNLMVEAGPKQTIKVIVKGWMIGGDAQPLLDAIQQRATAAEFGFDRSPVVIQRRNAGVIPGMR
jgi:hypothetical protein